MKRVALFACVVVLPALSVTANAKEYRKIDKGVGNCIFSTEPLPFKQEDQFKVQKSFTGDDTVYVRCYFAKKVRDYERDGKMKNSLRSPIEATVAAQAEGPAWFVTLSWKDDPLWWHRTRMVYVPSESGDWEQQRLDIVKKGTKEQCDFSYAKFKRPDECVDLETETINLGRKLNKSGRYTTEICVDAFYEKVDKQRMDDHLVMVDVVEAPNMSHGCFEITVDL